MMRELPTARDVAQFLFLGCNLKHPAINENLSILPPETDILAAYLSKSEGFAYLYKYKYSDPYFLASQFCDDNFHVHPRAHSLLREEDRARLITPGYIVGGIYGFDATVEGRGQKALVRKLDTRGSIFGVNKGEPFDGELGTEVLEGLLKGTSLRIYPKVNRQFFFGDKHPQRSTLAFIEHPLPIDFTVDALDEISARIAEYAAQQRGYSQLQRNPDERLRDLLEK